MYGLPQAGLLAQEQLEQQGHSMGIGKASTPLGCGYTYMENTILSHHE